jgi:hypothetical protein
MHPWFIRCVVLWSLLSGLCAAQFEFNSELIELSPPAAGSFALGQFIFCNNGSQPLTIKPIETTFGCTTATLDSYTNGLFAITTHLGRNVRLFAGVQQAVPAATTNTP